MKRSAALPYIPVTLPFTCEVCILAGGLSQRIGRDKARLRFGRRTMLGQIRATARQLRLPVRLIRRDAVPRCGPLGGIFTALQSSRAIVVLFVACDMPFVSRELLKTMLDEFAPAQNALFASERGRAGFPFILRRKTLPLVERQIAKSELSLQTLAKVLKAKRYRAPRAFAPQLRNINTPADWKRANRLWARNRERAKE